ncbi:MAG: YggS family pyridoxal phosphate-dependent enzyme [Microbacterium sp.]|uniref:YggS family pyridoxal phosphate-dependent enzyme n=1 Tax=Microbacterium sp. TaxID=51671 RepID=UPI003A85A931
MDTLGERLAAVDAAVADAARDAGRDPAEITRIVVTKFHPPELVRALHVLGVAAVGENRQQELTAKIDAVGTELPGLHWHFIGQAQTNKARALRQAASIVPLTVHSVDRARLVRSLDAAAGPGDPIVDVLLQVNLTDDPGRGGVAPDGAVELAEQVLTAPSLRLRGVMAVAPLDEPPASAFSRLRTVSDGVRTVAPDAVWISAGMTGDFAEAIAVGATHLRIGTAITGPRPAGG